jgi:hypothetical protein
VANLRALNVAPHVVQNDRITTTGKRRQSAIDGRTTRHKGYGLSQFKNPQKDGNFRGLRMVVRFIVG